MVSLFDWFCFRSVHLARRVLQLERANTSLRNEMEREKKKKELLGKEVTTQNLNVVTQFACCCLKYLILNQDNSFLQLSKATSLLNEAQQPYNYLIESIRARDSQNQSLNEQLALMEEETRSNYFVISWLTNNSLILVQNFSMHQTSQKPIIVSALCFPQY